MPKRKEERIQIANDELLENGNVADVDQFFTSGYVLHTGGKEYKGPGFVKRLVQQLRLAIPNLRVVEITILIQKGDTIGWQRTLSGTHKADLKGIPKTGKKVTWTDMMVTRFEGAKIAEEWSVSDLAAQLLLKQPRT